jgi:mannose-6-phosphate isomerase
MTLRPLYPLTFRPVLKRYLWGGQRLGTVLGKPIGDEADYAESWEIADHEHGQSVVAAGPLAGITLHELVLTRGEELLGRHAPQSRFPLLFKYLDCQRDLSVQVHPSDAEAARLTPPDLGKTEAWLILDARPGSRVYAGLRPGCDRASLAAAIASGQTAECLHSFEARAGQCVFVPAGTVHALGGGLLVAEIQQASDTTYRLYDWDRVGPDGQPRKLHIDEALNVVDYMAIGVEPRSGQPAERPHIERLVACDKFVLDRWRLLGPERLGGDQRFHIVSVLEGEIALDAAQLPYGGPPVLRRGQTMLLPASHPAVVLQPAVLSVLVDMYLPAAM